MTFKKILCPIDFSRSSLKALAYALDLGRTIDRANRVLRWGVTDAHRVSPQRVWHADVGARNTAGLLLHDDQTYMAGCLGRFPQLIRAV